MKSFLRKLVLLLLKSMAKFRLRRFKGKVVAVTGSVGKTSTKEAIYAVLNSQMRVKKTKKSMNSEFGLPLTILDIESGFSSITKWSWLLLKAFYHCLFRDYSEVLLLELGVDRPKDMDYLLSIVKPDISVMTNVFPVHLDEGQFKDLEDVFTEKRKIIDRMDKNGLAILNIDNPYLARLYKERGKKGSVSFGRSKEADFFATGIKQSSEGMRFILNTKDKRYEVETGVLGEYQIYVMLPALICAERLGMPMEEAVVALQRFALPPGRMGIIPGINESIILDSSYNSSPEALKEALKVLKAVGLNRRKVAVLGNMNELGESAKESHEMMGEVAAENCDVLLTVGGNAKLIGAAAEESGMEKTSVHHFRSAPEAAEYFKDKVKKDDVILVKGSQNRVRLERFVKELMQNPDDAEKLLVRQGRSWNKKL